MATGADTIVNQTELTPDISTLRVLAEFHRLNRVGVGGVNIGASSGVSGGAVVGVPTLLSAGCLLLEVKRWREKT